MANLQQAKQPKASYDYIVDGQCQQIAHNRIASDQMQEPVALTEVVMQKTEKQRASENLKPKHIKVPLGEVQSLN